MTRTMRPIELGVAYGGDHGTWDTEYVDIPLDTPDAALESIAIETYTRENWGDESIQHVWVYSIPNLDDLATWDDEWIDDAEDDNHA